MTLSKEWSEEKEKANCNNTKLVFDDQKKVGEQIVRVFKEKDLVTLCAPPQWGKTGVSLYVSYKMAKKKIKPENVFFITGMSDRSWVSQTKERVLPMWRKNVYHRNTLHKFKQKIQEMKEKKNILIFIDECHLANKKDHTLGNVIQDLHFNNSYYLSLKNIKILQISATPSNSLIDASGWSNHEVVCPKVGKGYVSFETILKEKRIYDTQNLEDRGECKKYIKKVTKKEPMYHLIRSVSAGPYGSIVYRNILTNFRKICMLKDFSLIELNMTKTEKEVQEIYDSLQEKPEKHTFILIKNMLGASKTLDDEFIGSVHESTPSKKDYSSEVQGLPGRLCGWTKKGGKDGVKIFCDRFIIERYVELYSSQFDYEKEEFEWSDSRLSINLKGKLKSKVSYLSPDESDRDIKDEYEESTVQSKVQSKVQSSIHIY
jgi:hypothetical protein